MTCQIQKNACAQITSTIYMKEILKDTNKVLPEQPSIVSSMWPENQDQQHHLLQHKPDLDTK